MTTTAQINRYPDVPLPPGAKPSEWWDVEDGEQTFRCVEGTPRLIGASRTRVYTHCTQWEDGRVEDGATEPTFHSAPGVSLDLIDDHGDATDTGITFTSAEARDAAAALIAAADEIDGWVGKRHDGRLRTIAHLLASAHTDLLGAAAGSGDPDRFYQAASQLLAARARIDDAMEAVR
jgi:hypothetical protein